MDKLVTLVNEWNTWWLNVWYDTFGEKACTVIELACGAVFLTACGIGIYMLVKKVAG